MSGLAQTPVTYSDFTWQWTQVGAIFPPCHAAFSCSDGAFLTDLTLQMFFPVFLLGFHFFHSESKGLVISDFMTENF